MTAVDGFSCLETSDGDLWLAEGFAAEAETLGLADRSRWEEHLAAGVPGGRGQVAFVESSGGTVVLKQLRRGGLAGPFGAAGSPHAAG